MRSPSMATSPCDAGAPVPSTILPPRMTMSCMVCPDSVGDEIASFPHIDGRRKPQVRALSRGERLPARGALLIDCAHGPVASPPARGHHAQHLPWPLRRSGGRPAHPVQREPSVAVLVALADMTFQLGEL